MAKKQEQSELTTPEKKTLTPSHRGFSPFFEDMDRYTSALLRHPFSFMTQPFFDIMSEKWPEAPVVDMFEENDELVVKAELPGIDKENLNPESVKPVSIIAS